MDDVLWIGRHTQDLEVDGRDPVGHVDLLPLDGEQVGCIVPEGRAGRVGDNRRVCHVLGVALPGDLCRAASEDVVSRV